MFKKLIELLSPKKPKIVVVAKKRVLLKLPIMVEEFKGIQNGCKECFQKAKGLEMSEEATNHYLEQNCPDCLDEESQYESYITHDYIDPHTIQHFFATGVDERSGNETTSIMFPGNRLVRYQISEPAFINKIKDFVTIIE